MVCKTSIIDKRLDIIRNELVNIGTTYFSFIILDKHLDMQHSYSSNQDWTNEFKETGLYKDCHLLQLVHQKSVELEEAFTVCWDSVVPPNDICLKLQEIRNKKNISHGLGLCFPIPGDSKAIVTLTGKYMDHNFCHNALKHHEKLYKMVATALFPCFDYKNWSIS